MHLEHDPSTAPHPRPAAPFPRSSPPAPSRRTWRLLVAVLTLLALVVPEAGAVSRPVEHRRSVADPSVTKIGPRRYVAVSTGPRVPRLVSRNGLRWRPIAPALAARPAWARPGSGIWAADLVHVRGRWLLYFAAPVRGMGRTSRCIGVAAARSSTGRFRPVGHRPLVCPPAAQAPRADDRILDRHRTRPTYPTIGAIDPSVVVDRGRVFLLYKTDGKPSSIRLLRLRANGLHARGRSRLLLAARTVLENPVIVRHGRWLYLFMSAGDYTRCSYSTVWRRSRRITRWRGHTQRTLLARRSTGLCGPGGADVVVDRQRARLYFHGWTCQGTARPCTEPFRGVRRELHRRPVRALYKAQLRFTRHGVRIGPSARARAERRREARRHRRAVARRPVERHRRAVAKRRAEHRHRLARRATHALRRR